MVGAVLLALVLDGNADEPSVLRWLAPSECPTAADVWASVEVLLVSDAHADLAVDLVLDAHVERTDTGWHMSLTSIDKENEQVREFTAESCEALAETAAVLTAIAIDPVAASESLVSTATEIAPESRPQLAEVDSDLIDLGDPVAEPTIADSVQPEPVRERSVSYGMRPAAGASYGPLPTWGPGIGLTAYLQIDWMRIEAQASYWFAQKGTYEGTDGVGASVDLWTAGARGCPTPSVKIVSFPLCVGAELGAMRGTGLGVSQSERVSSLWAAVTVGPGITIKIAERAALSVVADGLISLRRPAFHIAGREPVHRAASLGIRPYAGLELTFP